LTTLHYSSIQINYLKEIISMTSATFNPTTSAVTVPPEITLVPNNSLLTATPEEGRQLAVQMARLIIKLTQPDEAKRQQIREAYGNDAMMLIAAGHVVATEFATIAAANHYWQK
jgi:Hexameric tyrosine-coordinated heme protein (HTHP)